MLVEDPKDELGKISFSSSFSLLSFLYFSSRSLLSKSHATSRGLQKSDWGISAQSLAPLFRLDSRMCLEFFGNFLKTADVRGMFSR